MELLRKSIPDEIENYKQRYINLKCRNAKVILNVCFFQFITAALHQNQINLENVKVCFLNFFLSNDFEMKINEDKKLQIFSRKSLKLEPLNTLKLDIDLMLAFQGNISDIKCNYEEILMLESPISNGPVFHIPYLSVCNLEDKTLEIKENSCLFTIDLSLDTPNIILMKTERDILEKRQSHVTECSLQTSLNNLTNLMLGMTSFYSRINSNFSQSSNFLSKIERQQHISNLVSQAEINVCELPVGKKSKQIICNYSSQREKIGQILLGQNLLKNNGIFSSKLMKQLQREDANLNNIILDLEQGSLKYRNKGFVLQNSILYKESLIFGKQVLKLAIPDHLTACIIENFHKTKAMHYPPKQLSKIFQTNFYSVNHDKIISKIGKKCDICQL